MMHYILCLQALRKVITDPLGTPLFDSHMAAAGLPVTAEMRHMDLFPGDSISDQVWVAEPCLGQILCSLLGLWQPTIF